jgi:hypothetical protein
MKRAFFLFLIPVLCVVAVFPCTAAASAGDKAQPPSQVGSPVQGTPPSLVSQTVQSVPPVGSQSGTMVAPAGKDGKGDTSTGDKSDSAPPQQPPGPPGGLRIIRTN